MLDLEEILEGNIFLNEEGEGFTFYYCEEEELNFEEEDD